MQDLKTAGRNTESLKKLGLQIAKDAGIRSVSSYEIGRFIQIIQEYYSDLDETEIRLAFDMLMVGKLDEYLTLDKYGQPDTSHYQSFSVAWITKVLNAYKKRKNEMKSRQIENEQKPLLLEDNRSREFRKKLRKYISKIFLYYKYHCVMPELSDIDVKLIYEELYADGKIGDAEIENRDTRIVFNSLRQKIAQGYIHWRQAAEIYREQESHEDVQVKAYVLAMRRKIEERFKEAIEEC